MSVVLRLIQDIPFFQAAGPLTDPVTAALVTVEAAPLVAGAFLGLAAGLLAWLGWTGRVRSGTAVGIVFSLVFAGGLFLGLRGYPPAQQVGWALVLLSAATLITFFRFSNPPISR
jgi:ABC-type Mn2+/Zn2+ transport system permease subunit